MRAGSIRLTQAVATIVMFTRCGGSTRAPAAPEEPSDQAQAAVQEDSTPTQPRTGTEAPPPSTPQAHDPKLDIPPYGASSSRVMQAHFTDALLIRKAVIDGRPEQASNPATVIANTQDLDALPPGWRPFVQDMRQSAQRIINGTTVATVSAATADLGVACGACHLEHGGPPASLDPAPDAGTSVASRMKRHGWATERLWEGLAVPSSEAWQLGTETLSADPFPKEVLDQGGIDAKTAAADFTRLVAKAPAQKTVHEQAAIYAELLLTCGACHRAFEPVD